MEEFELLSEQVASFVEQDTGACSSRRLQSLPRLHNDPEESQKMNAVRCQQGVLPYAITKDMLVALEAAGVDVQPLASHSPVPPGHDDKQIPHMPPLVTLSESALATFRAAHRVLLYSSVSLEMQSRGIPLSLCQQAGAICGAVSAFWEMYDQPDKCIAGLRMVAQVLKKSGVVASHPSHSPFSLAKYLAVARGALAAGLEAAGQVVWGPDTVAAWDELWEVVCEVMADEMVREWPNLASFPMQWQSRSHKWTAITGSPLVPLPNSHWGWGTSDAPEGFAWFSDERDPLGFLALTSPATITSPLDGKAWPSAFHLLHALLWADVPEVQESIWKARTPSAVESIIASSSDGQPLPIDPDKLQTVLRWKFTGNPELATALLCTEGAVLVYHGNDAVLGDGGATDWPVGGGKNLLGVALMKIRAELRESRGGAYGETSVMWHHLIAQRCVPDHPKGQQPEDSSPPPDAPGGGEDPSTTPLPPTRPSQSSTSTSTSTSSSSSSSSGGGPQGRTTSNMTKSCTVSDPPRALRPLQPTVDNRATKPSPFLFAIRCLSPNREPSPAKEEGHADEVLSVIGKIAAAYSKLENANRMILTNCKQKGIELDLPASLLRSATIEPELVRLRHLSSAPQNAGVLAAKGEALRQMEEENARLKEQVAALKPMHDANRDLVIEVAEVRRKLEAVEKQHQAAEETIKDLQQTLSDTRGVMAPPSGVQSLLESISKEELIQDLDSYKELYEAARGKLDRMAASIEAKDNQVRELKRAMEGLAKQLEECQAEVKTSDHAKQALEARLSREVATRHQREEQLEATRMQLEEAAGRRGPRGVDHTPPPDRKPNPSPGRHSPASVRPAIDLYDKGPWKHQTLHRSHSLTATPPSRPCTFGVGDRFAPGMSCYMGCERSTPRRRQRPGSISPGRRSTPTRTTSRTTPTRPRSRSGFRRIVDPAMTPPLYA